MVSRETFGADHFFDLKDVWFADLLRSVDFPWELLAKGFKENWIRSKIHPNVGSIRRTGSLVLDSVEVPAGTGVAVIEAGSYIVGDEIELRAGALVEAGAWVTGPTILGEESEVRHGAYVRGGVLTGRKAVIGHTSEIKSSVLLNGAKAPHFAYVGDSILGNRVNLGAGTKVSNLKITNTEIKLQIGSEVIATGLRKMGAIIGDETETGCNSVLNPGTLLGKRCLVYPAIPVRAMYYAPGSKVK